jgi:integrase
MLYKRCAHTKAQHRQCEHPWWVQVKWKRVRIRESLARYFPAEPVSGRWSRTKAADLERQFTLDVRAGKYAQWKETQNEAKHPAAIPASRTWTAFCDFYIEEHILAQKRRWDHTLKNKLKHIRNEWSARAIDSITVADIQTFLNSFGKRGCAPATGRHYHALVRHMLKFALRTQWLDVNPIKEGSIQLPSVRNERTRRLLPEEEDRLWPVLEAMEDEAASDALPARRFLKGVVTITLDTGLRRGSILALRFGMVKWDTGNHGIVDVPSNILKQRRPQQLALTSRARVVLESRRRFYFAMGRYGPDTVIFGKDVGTMFLGTCSFEQAWQEAKRRAGLRDANLHFHDLRGEAASRLSDMGMPLATIQRFLGHSSLEMTQRYLRARVGEIEDTASALENYKRATKEATPPVNAQSS